MDVFKNFSWSTVATAPTPASSGTSLVVAAGTGTAFPAVSFNAVVWPVGAQPTNANAEIVRVTGIATDTFTIVRQKESTSARSIIVGDQIAAAFTAGNIPAYEYAYNEFTANVSVTATTEATANTVVTATAVTFDGTTPVVLEFYSPHVIHSAANALIQFWLYDGAASIGQIGALTGSATAGFGVFANMSRRLTPSAAAHTYSIRAQVVSGTGTVSGGAGGAGVALPGYIRITRV